MQLQFIITVTVDRRDEDIQTKTEFEKEGDGRAMAVYLKEKVISAIEGSWQHNAEVKKIKFQFIQP